MSLSTYHTHPRCYLCARGECIQQVTQESSLAVPVVAHGYGMEHLTGSWIAEEHGDRVVVYYRPWEPPNYLPC